MTDYVVLKHCSAGNDSVGEMWIETKVFPADATLDEVMLWAEGEKSYEREKRLPSRKQITLTRPDTVQPNPSE